MTTNERKASAGLHPQRAGPVHQGGAAERDCGSEGRVLACETIGLTPPLLVDVTNAEYAASLSADILLLNMFDVQHPVINALPKVPEVETVRELKRLTGRVVGINLEPCDLQAAKSNDGTLWKNERRTLGHRRKCTQDRRNGR